MGVLGGALPPGLRGYVVGQEQSARRQADQMQGMQGILAIQGALADRALQEKLLPLKMKEAEAKLAEMDRLNAILAQFQGGNGGQVPGGPPGAPQGAMGGPGGIPPNVQAMLLHPKLAPLGREMAKQHQPTDKMRELIAQGVQPGSLEWNAALGTQYTQQGAWQRDPATGGVRLAPGFAQGQGEVAGAEAAARSQYETVQVPDGRGGMITMPKAQAMQLLGGGAGAPQQPQAPSPMSGRSPQEQAAIQQVLNASMRGQHASVTVPAQGAPSGMGRIPTSSVVGGGLGYTPPEAQLAADRTAATKAAELAAERTAAAPADTARLESVRNKAANVSQKVEEALKNVGAFTTGIPGAVFGMVPGSKAYDLAKTIDTIKANIGFQELQAMREASPTGGALGQVAVQELNFLQAALANLDKGQSPELVKRNLEAVATHFNKWKSAVEQAHGERHGSVPAPQGGVRRYNPATGRIE